MAMATAKQRMRQGQCRLRLQQQQQQQQQQAVLPLAGPAAADTCSRCPFRASLRQLPGGGHQGPSVDLCQVGHGDLAAMWAAAANVYTPPPPSRRAKGEDRLCFHGSTGSCWRHVGVTACVTPVDAVVLM